MKTNYNDIIDVFLTFLNDERIKGDMLIYGSIVPYLISKKEPRENLKDTYILVETKEIKKFRKVLKELSKEYLFDIVDDSLYYGKDDYGFKMNYEGNIIGIFPYELYIDEFIIKTYKVDFEEKKIKLKTKVLDKVSSNSIVRQAMLTKNNLLKVCSPEYIMLYKVLKSKEFYKTETYKLLNQITDESIIKVLENSIAKIKINIETKKIKRKLFFNIF